MKAKPVSLSLYFGIPGAGKSTYAAYLAKKDMKKGRKVWSNFGITGAMKCEKADFGKFMMSDGRLIIDEAGLEYDNRKMAMTTDEIYFFKYHRHYQLDVDFFSQGLDVDIKIRKLARHIYLIKPSLLPFQRGRVLVPRAATNRKPIRRAASICRSTPCLPVAGV